MIYETLQCMWGSTSTFVCLSPYAYEPMWIYFFVVVMMLLSAVGLPFPEEVTLVSVGILAYIGSHPELYPPPYPGAPFVHPTTAAVVAFLAVFGSDLLIYFIGRFFGPKVFEWGPVKKVISSDSRIKIQSWTNKYGSLACGIFRFTPGVRFPGHLACGMVKFPLWKFMLIDGLAALISVPTQILLFAHYGEAIYGVFQKSKYVILGALVAFGIFYIIKKWTSKKEVQS
jgi:membrane protein DedA with SNARE-associated domain